MVPPILGSSSAPIYISDDDEEQVVSIPLLNSAIRDSPASSLSLSESSILKPDGWVQKLAQQAERLDEDDSFARDITPLEKAGPPLRVVSSGTLKRKREEEATRPLNEPPKGGLKPLVDLFSVPYNPPLSEDQPESKGARRRRLKNQKLALLEEASLNPGQSQNIAKLRRIENQLPRPLPPDAPTIYYDSPPVEGQVTPMHPYRGFILPTSHSLPPKPQLRPAPPPQVLPHYVSNQPLPKKNKKGKADPQKTIGLHDDSGVRGTFFHLIAPDHPLPQNRTLIMDGIPPNLFHKYFIGSWCQTTCGSPPVYLELNKTRALVEFATKEQAWKAFNSPRLRGRALLGSGQGQQSADLSLVSVWRWKKSVRPAGAALPPNMSDSSSAPLLPTNAQTSGNGEDVVMEEGEIEEGEILSNTLKDDVRAAAKAKEEERLNEQSVLPTNQGSSTLAPCSKKKLTKQEKKDLKVTERAKQETRAKMRFKAKPAVEGNMENATPTYCSVSGDTSTSPTPTVPSTPPPQYSQQLASKIKQKDEWKISAAGRKVNVIDISDVESPAVPLSRFHVKTTQKDCVSDGEDMELGSPELPKSLDGSLGNSEQETSKPAGPSTSSEKASASKGSNINIALPSPAAKGTSNHSGVEERLRLLVLKSKQNSRAGADLKTDPSPLPTPLVAIHFTPPSASTSPSTPSSASASRSVGDPSKTVSSCGSSLGDLGDLAESFITEVIMATKPPPPKPSTSSVKQELEAKQKMLEAQIAESKHLMAKLAAAKTREEKDGILRILRERSRAMDESRQLKVSTPVRTRWPQTDQDFCMLIVSDDEGDDR